MISPLAIAREPSLANLHDLSSHYESMMRMTLIARPDDFNNESRMYYPHMSLGWTQRK